MVWRNWVRDAINNIRQVSVRKLWALALMLLCNFGVILFELLSCPGWERDKGGTSIGGEQTLCVSLITKTSWYSINQDVVKSDRPEKLVLNGMPVHLSGTIIVSLVNLWHIPISESNFRVFIIRVHRHMECKHLSMENIRVHKGIKEWFHAWFSKWRVCHSDDCIKGIMEASLLSHHAERIVCKGDSIIVISRGNISNGDWILHEIAFEIATTKRDLDMLFFVVFWFDESMPTRLFRIKWIMSFVFLNSFFVIVFFQSCTRYNPWICGTSIEKNSNWLKFAVAIPRFSACWTQEEFRDIAIVVLVVQVHHDVISWNMSLLFNLTLGTSLEELHVLLSRSAHLIQLVKLVHSLLCIHCDWFLRDFQCDWSSWLCELILFVIWSCLVFSVKL